MRSRCRSGRSPSTRVSNNRRPVDGGCSGPFHACPLTVLESLPAAWPQVAYGMAVVLCAGIVRGFAGFGFSALTVAGMSLFFSPAQVVPAAFVLEVLASVSMMRSIWRDIHWGWLRPLLIGNAVGIPVGVWLLVVVPEAPLRAIVSLVILCVAVLLLSGFKPPWRDSGMLRLTTGVLSGAFNGLAAI